MNNPLVSICIPAYKCEKTIEKAVNSALSQTYKNIEIIIIDDNSPDNTFKILESIKDDRVHLYKNEHNLGMCDNWNKCVSYANGEYIHFLHCDDILLPDSVNEKIDAVNKHKDVALVFSATEIINKSDNVLMVRRYKNKDTIVNGLKICYESLHKRNLFGEPSNVLFKKEIFEKVGGFCHELKYVIDWDLWIRIAAFGNVCYINKVLSKYRISNTNVTSSLLIKEMLEDDAKMVRNLQNSNFLHLSLHQIIIHRLVFRARAIIRYFYMKFWANKLNN